MHYVRWRTHGDTTITNRRTNGDGKGYIPAKGVLDKHEHVRLAEVALGRPLPHGAIVHHVDEDRSNNANRNLVICPSQKYHALLHIRMRALKETGNANSRKCRICGIYGLVPEVTVTKSDRVYHPACNRLHVANYLNRRQSL